MTWGGENSGGDSRTVQYQLTNVRTVVAADRAFAAILLDGTVTCSRLKPTWEVLPSVHPRGTSRGRLILVDVHVDRSSFRQ